MIGRISSNKMTGTVGVTVEVFKIHPIYKKRLKRSQKFLAATSEKLSIGDRVEIKEVRPISKRVAFSVVKILDRAEILPPVRSANDEIKDKDKKE
jgi:small subunit ribosomal protein S17